MVTSLQKVERLSRLQANIRASDSFTFEKLVMALWQKEITPCFINNVEWNEAPGFLNIFHNFYKICLFMLWPNFQQLT